MARRLTGRVAGTLFCAALVAGLSSCANPRSSPPVAVASSASAGARAAAGQFAPQAAAAAPSSPIPGIDPSIQHWFLKLDKSKVAFDNALFQAEQGIAKHVSSMCKPLSQVARPILSALPSLRNIPSPAGAKIADAMEPVMTTFSKIGDLCATGDFAGAQAQLPNAVQQQADAQATIDEILDGDANPSGGQ